MGLFSRRKMFSILAAVPFVGSACIAVAAPTIIEKQQIKPRLPFSYSLGRIRDELKPGLRQFETDKIELDIFCDYITDALLIKGYNLKQKRALGFVITREEMTSGRYKASFAPCLHKLISLLKEEVV